MKSFRINNNKMIKFIFVIGCNGLVKNCGEIHAKYLNDGEYFLAINLSSSSYSNDGEQGGEILADAVVTKSIYDSVMVGDDYCFEN